MIGFWTVAYLVTPLIVVGLGYVAVRLHERSGRRHPAE
jgi:hypothetical protein